MAVTFDESAPVLEITDLKPFLLDPGRRDPGRDRLLAHRAEGREHRAWSANRAAASPRWRWPSCSTWATTGPSRAGASGSRGWSSRSSRPTSCGRFRGSHISMIYQEPFAALNPSLTLGTQLKEVPMTHDGISDAEAHDRALQVLNDVRLPDADSGHGGVSAPDLRRPAAARGHRHGAALQSLAAAPRRADDGARRHGRGRHHQAHHRHQPEVRHLANLHLAQPRPHPGGVRPGVRHVLRRGGRGGRRSTRCSRGRSIPTPTVCSAASRCRRRTRTRPRSSPSPGSFRFPTSARAAAISARGATSSRTGAATPRTFRWSRWRARR